METAEIIFMGITVFIAGAFFGSIITSSWIRIKESMRPSIKESDKREEFEWDVGLYSDEWLNRDKETDDE